MRHDGVVEGGELITDTSARGGGVTDGQELVDEALRRIRDALVMGVARAAHEVGRYLLETFFEGRPDRYRDRTFRSAEFVELCSRDDELNAMGLSRTTLTDCLRVYIQVKELGVEDIGELPFSAQVALLPAPPEARRPLARRALAEGMGIRELRDAVKQVRPPEDRRWRPPKLVVDRSLGYVRRWLGKVDEGWDDEVVERGGDRMVLLREAREAKEQLDAIVSRLEELCDE